MVIYDELITEDGTYKIEYHDADNFDGLPPKQVTQAYGVCMVNGKLVIGHRRKKLTWGLIGGRVEPNETFSETLKREIKEESNMEVVAFAPIGYQIATDENGIIIYQLRYACKVRPYGVFVEDPDEGIDIIKLIEPGTYKQYFDWGKIGDRVISRGLKIYNSALADLSQ